MKTSLIDIQISNALLKTYLFFYEKKTLRHDLCILHMTEQISWISFYIWERYTCCQIGNQKEQAKPFQSNACMAILLLEESQLIPELRMRADAEKGKTR